MNQSDWVSVIRVNFLTIIGVVFAALLTVAYLFFFSTTLLPLWQTRAALSQRLQFALDKQNGRFELEPGELQAIQQQTAALEAQLAVESAIFLTEPQAATTLDMLFQYAELSSVDIVNLEALPTTPKDSAAVFDGRQFRVEMVGEAARLLTFLSLLRETAIETVSTANLQFVRSDPASSLTFDLLIYTSPFSSGEVLESLSAVEGVFAPPLATPEPALSAADTLFAGLDEPWQAEDWPTVLSIIDQILALEPTYPEIRAKQYSALVNNGYRLISLGELEQARAQFEKAVVLNPQSGEAQAGLATLDGLMNTPVIYTVQRGDTLFSIARRYDVTVEQLRAANGLFGNTIMPGQQLTIP